MKKSIYLPILLVTIALLSFATPSKTFTHTKSRKESKEKPSCAAPTGLNATKSGTTVTLSWSASAASYSYGGYYNYTTSTGPATGFFGSTTTNLTVGITVPSTTTSITFSVVSRCSDGTTGQSAPFSKTF